jgi:hypothetical protein
MDAIKAVIGELQAAKTPPTVRVWIAVSRLVRDPREPTRRRCRSHIAGLLVPKQHHGALVYLDR